MTLQEFQNYVESRGDALTKIEPVFECGETIGTFYVVKTKETYVFGDEDKADQKVDEARQDPGFAGVEKKFKAGKISKKTGDILTPDTYTVVIKLTK